MSRDHSPTEPTAALYTNALSPASLAPQWLNMNCGRAPRRRRLPVRHGNCRGYAAVRVATVYKPSLLSLDESRRIVEDVRCARIHV